MRTAIEAWAHRTNELSSMPGVRQGFVPFAARWPLEITVLPHRQIGLLSETSLAERSELAVIAPALLRAVGTLDESPSPSMARI
ncbi:MAG: hypothetical protein CVT64_10230 [Actinobacteria bacterium HGW-Actinobacteria-4]|nr:MAG: hypothetical protein CVT64_10230 [Actinobacteria bacterium HGW-Actinobacteria-4]